MPQHTITTRDIVGTGYVRDELILELHAKHAERGKEIWRLRSALREQVGLHALKDELIAALKRRIDIMEKQRAA